MVSAVHETYQKCTAELRYSPRTFAGGPGHGSGMECWRHVTAWAAVSLKSLRAGAGAAGSPLSAPHHLPDGEKHKHINNRIKKVFRQLAFRFSYSRQNTGGMRRR